MAGRRKPRGHGWSADEPWNRLEVERLGDVEQVERDELAAAGAEIGLHVQSIYQPGYRFWSFQWIESAIFVVLALALFGLVIWRVRSRTP